MKSKKSIYLLLTLLVTPLSFAFDCTQIPDKQFCNSVVSSDLTQAEKDTVLAVALYSNPDFPDHALVESWNTNIAFNQAPDGVPASNKGTIKEAWLKIIAVMPSVIDTKLLSPGYGKLLTAFNYRVEVPSGTLPGDCATNQYPYANQSVLNVYLNSIRISKSRLAEFSTGKDMDFQAELQITSTIMREHYQLKKYCCNKKTPLKYCKKFCYSCEYCYTDYTTDQLSLTDYFHAAYYNPVPKTSFEITNKYYDTLAGKFNITNQTYFSINFDGAYYSQHSYAYSLNYSLFPYYALTLQAANNPREETRNMNINKNEFTVKDSKECTINYSTHFADYSLPCDLSFESDNVEIKTDKASYTENETIYIDLLPKETLLEVSYANKTQAVKNTAEFTALFPYNRITAKLGSTEREKIISISKKSRIYFFLNLGVFSGILLFIYEVLKKYIGIWL